MAAGNWMPELVALAGGAHALRRDRARTRPGSSWTALRAADPDVIVVVPCGFDLARTRAELGAARRAAAASASCARCASGRVYLVDGNQYFNRPGPRLVESLEILAEMLHPEAFPARHRGTGWEPHA